MVVERRFLGTSMHYVQVMWVARRQGFDLTFMGKWYWHPIFLQWSVLPSTYSPVFSAMQSFLSPEVFMLSYTTLYSSRKGMNLKGESTAHYSKIDNTGEVRKWYSKRLCETLSFASQRCLNYRSSAFDTIVLFIFTVDFQEFGRSNWKKCYSKISENWQLEDKIRNIEALFAAIVQH